jgi:hypothetical protein
MTVEQDPVRIAAANHYQSYMRGWKNGACVNAMDATFIARETSDPMRKHYEIGYSDGRKSRNVAANIATNLTGHVPSVLRLADGERPPRHLFFDGIRERAWEMLHHVACDPETLSGAWVLVISDSPIGALADLIRTAPKGDVGCMPDYRHRDATLTWRNGVIAHVVSPRKLETIRGLDVAFALVDVWPCEDDWWSIVEPTVRLGRAQIVAIDSPPASWSQRPGCDS